MPERGSLEDEARWRAVTEAKKCHLLAERALELSVGSIILQKWFQLQVRLASRSGAAPRTRHGGGA